MITNKNKLESTNFAKQIIPNVNGINLSSDEISKLKVFLNYELNSSLFDAQLQIYSFIGANFNQDNFYIIIPFISKGQETLNIIAHKPKEVTENFED